LTVKPASADALSLIHGDVELGFTSVIRKRDGMNGQVVVAAANRLNTRHSDWIRLEGVHAPRWADQRRKSPRVQSPVGARVHHCVAPMDEHVDHADRSVSLPPETSPSKPGSERWADAAHNPKGSSHKLHSEPFSRRAGLPDLLQRLEQGSAMQGTVQPGKACTTQGAWWAMGIAHRGKPRSQFARRLGASGLTPK
jgi:hypothetical protein